MASKANLAFDWVLHGYSPPPPQLCCLVPPALHARAELLVGECLLALWDKLLITYKEPLASPKNASVKQGSAQSAQPSSAPGSLGQDALSQSGGQKVSKRRHVSLAGLFGVFLLQHR